MSTKTIEEKVEEVKDEKLTLDVPFPEFLKEQTDEWLEEQLISRTEALSKIKWKIVGEQVDNPGTDDEKKRKIWLSRELMSFLKTALNTVPWQGMSAYELVGMREALGDQKGDELTLETHVVDAIWRTLLTKYEGKGLKDAQKYVAVCNVWAQVVREIQNKQKEIQEIGFEINRREVETQQAEADKVEVVELETEKTSKTKTKGPKLVKNKENEDPKKK